MTQNANTDRTTLRRISFVANVNEDNKSNLSLESELESEEEGLDLDLSIDMTQAEAEQLLKSLTIAIDEMHRIDDTNSLPHRVVALSDYDETITEPGHTFE